MYLALQNLKVKELFVTASKSYLVLEPCWVAEVIWLHLPVSQPVKLYS